MNNKHFFLFLFLLGTMSPIAYAATEDAIREVGYAFVGTISAGLFAYLLFYMAFKLDEQHNILKYFLMLSGFTGIINMTGMIANQGGKYFSLFQTNIWILYGVVAYIIVALFYWAITYYIKTNSKGGYKDD